jgi:hypothetical protein
VDVAGEADGAALSLIADLTDPGQVGETYAAVAELTSGTSA